VLRYANCGHFPPLLLRADGRVDQLHSTATVLGLFQTWSTPVVDVMLDEGDLLIVYTDGIIEAANPREEEFGLDRLIEFGRAHRDVPAAALVDMIQSAVMQFTQAPPADDLTVVVARVVRPPRT
jgi:serine phosphatase RsbU (regulator of sigma subunit)